MCWYILFSGSKIFIGLKEEFDKLDINKLTNVVTSLNSLETEVDDLDVSKFKTLPVYLKQLIDAVNNEVVKDTKFNAIKRKVNNLEKGIPDETTLIHINQYNVDKQNLEKMEILRKKIPNTSNLGTTTVLYAKIRKYITK